MFLKYMFYILLALLTAGQFSRVGGVYLFDIFAIFFLFVSFTFFLINKKFVVHKYFILFLIFSICAFGSLTVNASNYRISDLTESLMYLLRFLIYLGSALSVYLQFKNNILTKKELFYSVIISGVLFSFAGFIQLILLPDFTTLNPLLGWDPHKNRLASTFFDPNFAGAYLVIVFTLLLNFGSTFVTDRKMLFLLYLVLVLAIFLTFSRSAWAFLAVVIFCYGLIKDKRVLLLSFLLAFLAYFAVPRVQTRISGITDPADSASLRYQSWEKGLVISKDNLAIGVGFNAFKFAQERYGFLTPDTVTAHSASGTDSSLLLVLATTGIIGAAIYVLAWAFPLAENIFKKDTGSIVIVSLTLGLLVESQFINSLFYPQIMFLMFLILFMQSEKDLA